MLVGRGTNLGYYVYHVDAQGPYGENMWWNCPPLTRGAWYCVEGFVRLNSIATSGGLPVGRKDGVLLGWLNGQLVFDRRDLRFRNVDYLKVESMWFDVYEGGSWVAREEMDLYVDELVVADQRVGAGLGCQG